MNEQLAAIERPNGKLYRPRRVVAYACGEDAESVLVVGTHDYDRAQVLANEIAEHIAGSGYVAVDWSTGWYRDGFECGERRWVHDDVRGRAGVFFQEIVEGAS